MKNVEKEDGSREDLVKIVRNESIGYIKWDSKMSIGSSETSTGSNNWSDSSIMMLLNPGYETNELLKSSNSNVKGSLYWNRKNGVCYAFDYETSGSSTIAMECGMGSKGLYNNETKTMIETVKWHLGGVSGYIGQILVDDLYNLERGTETCETLGTCINSRETKWEGQVGLMYFSDFGYATDGGSYERNKCLNDPIFTWTSEDSGELEEECRNSSWLFNSESSQWTITPYNNSSYQVLNINRPGIGEKSTATTQHGFATRPTLFLSANVMVADNELSDGSEQTPYILVP